MEHFLFFVEILWNKIIIYSSKIIPKTLAPNFDETKLDMETSYDAGDGLIIHADEKVNGNSSDGQRQKCILPYLFLSACKIKPLSQTAATNETRADTLHKYAIVIPFSPPLTSTMLALNG